MKKKKKIILGEKMKKKEKEKEKAWGSGKKTKNKKRKKKKTCREWKQNVKTEKKTITCGES
jgi:hypothetical protein